MGSFLVSKWHWVPPATLTQTRTPQRLPFCRKVDRQGAKNKCANSSGSGRTTRATIRSKNNGLLSGKATPGDILIDFSFSPSLQSPSSLNRLIPSSSLKGVEGEP